MRLRLSFFLLWMSNYFSIVCWNPMKCFCTSVKNWLNVFMWMCSPVLYSPLLFAEYLLEGLMLKMKLQYFDHLMRRTDSLEKTLMLGGIGAGGEGDNRGWDGWMASPTRWTWVWVNPRRWWWTGRPGVLQFMGSQSWTRLSDWTELKWIPPSIPYNPDYYS